MALIAWFLLIFTAAAPGTVGSLPLPPSASGAVVVRINLNSAIDCVVLRLEYPGCARFDCRASADRGLLFDGFERECGS